MQQFVKTFFEQSDSLDVFFQNITNAIAHGAKSLFLLTADGNNFDQKKLNNFLQQIPIPIFGGIFPRIIYGKSCVDRGSIVCGLTHAPQIELVTELSNDKLDPAKTIANFSALIKNQQTIMLFIDSMSKNITNLIEKLYQHIGGNVKYLGGGAGSLTFQQKKCIYSNQGLLQDCAQIIGFDTKALISIEHGWEKFMGPFVITESLNNVIKMIDYQPALQVYKNVIESNTQHRFNHENFFDIAKFFPFGIEMLDGSYVVRDPFTTKENSIICIADVPENSVVYILKGDANQLINAATKAASSLNQQLQQYSADNNSVLIFDCISRCLVLGNQINYELAAIRNHIIKEQFELIGASTIGEIASYGSISLEFFNKTLVLGVLLRN